jgi:hypothetical protein
MWLSELGSERVLTVSKSVRSLAQLVARKVLTVSLVVGKILTVSLVVRKVLTISTDVSTASLWDARARPALTVSKSTQHYRPKSDLEKSKLDDSQSSIDQHDARDSFFSMLGV